jgi:hypothetical protein
MSTKKTESKNSICIITQSLDKPGFRFKPDHSFYLQTAINKKRFGQLMRGEKEPSITELKTLCKHFGYNIKNLF